ncbi:MAG: ABC transporter substrate-binding protein [Pseudomonadota bacterium]
MSTLMRLLRALPAMAFLVVFGTAATASATTMEDIMERGTLRVAVQTQGPPISFVDANGERTGLAVEIVRNMAEDMGVELELQDYSWQGLIPALLSGKADLIAADMTPTPKRATQLLFTEPIFFTEIIAFANEDKGYSHWEDLKQDGATIGAPEASTYAAAADIKLPDLTMKEYQGGTAATAQAVSSGRVDAGISDSGTIKAFLEDYPEFEVLEGTLRKEPLSFATRPDSVHLLMFMDNYIRFTEHSGELGELLDYWWNSQDWEEDH